MTQSLQTARLTLRPLRATDLAPFAAMHADPEVVRHLGTGQTRTTAETWDIMARLLGQWALRGYGMFAIEETATARFAGRAGILQPYEWPAPELAFGFDRPVWGQGYATEASRVLLDWAWQAAQATLPLRQVTLPLRQRSSAALSMAAVSQVNH